MHRSLAAALALFAASNLADAMRGAAHAEDFQMEEQDCMGDAMRFCGPEIPDHAKILACLRYYQADISPACRALVAPKE